MTPAVEDPTSKLCEEPETGGAKEESIPVAAVDHELKQRAKTTSRMVFSAAAASTRYNPTYDIENKGYQDTADKVMEKFDMNKDGHYSPEEVKKIVLSLLNEQDSKKLFVKLFKAAGCLLILSWAGNFGLTWATLSLTRKLDTQGGALTDASGRVVSTQSRGPLLHIDLDRGKEERLRRLQAGDSVVAFEIDESPKVVHNAYVAVTNGGTPSFLLHGDGVQYSGTIGSDIIYIGDVNGVGVYSGIYVIHPQDDPEGPFKVTCKTTCTVEHVVSSSRRKLMLDLSKAEAGSAEVWSDLNHRSMLNKSRGSCFSPMSTVLEKTKGKMLLKDLQPGDSVLAANGIYQPYVLSAHSNPTKPTRFVQIHADGASGDNDPLEATPDHLIFVEGRNLPIPAGDVAAGDSLIGTNGPRRVTRVAAVDRVGFFTPLTADDTLFVDDVLATSVSAWANNGSLVNFRFAKVHLHSFMKHVAAPLMHQVCTKYDPRLCAAQYVTEDGDSYSTLIGAGIAVLFRMPPAFHPLFLLLSALGLVSFMAYYAAAAVPFAALALAGVRAFGVRPLKGKAE